MKQFVRSFSTGLFAAAIIMLAVYFLSDGSADTAENLELEELVPLVEQKGHRVVTEEDYIALSVSTNEEGTEEKETEENQTDSDESDSNEDADEETESDENETEEEENSDDPVEYTLTIESGMPSSEIGTQLEENDIIDDADDFSNYLEEHDYSLQIKATDHEVSSDMSFYELAEELISN
jgi:hypothetical protein